MIKNCKTSDIAVVTKGSTRITVYGETARLVNTLVGVAAIVSFIALLNKIAK